MENPSVDRLSAVNRVFQKFIAACNEEKMSPIEAVDALVRLLGVGSIPSLREALAQQETAKAVPSETTQSAPQSAKNISLTKEQVEKATSIARAEKAKRFGLSPKEVMLTSQEAKDAKARYRLMLSDASEKTSGPKSTLPPRSYSIDSNANVGAVPKGKEEVKSTSAPSPQVTLPTKKTAEAVFSEGGKKPVGVAKEPEGSRATQKTRIDNIRRLCLKAFPLAVIDPTVLHLVAYANHRARLSDQVSKYRSAYADSGIKDSLRGLPDPWEKTFCPESRRLLEEVTVNLRTQPDTPGTFVLQSADGGSFWNLERPSLVCPPELAAPLPEAILGEFERNTGLERA
jgi:hypothetical protein